MEGLQHGWGQGSQSAVSYRSSSTKRYMQAGGSDQQIEQGLNNSCDDRGGKREVSGTSLLDDVTELV